jgi:hypothetical protein
MLSEELLRKLINQELDKRYPHECPHCDWFQMNNKPPTMRVCQNPLKVVLDSHGFCAYWVIAKDLHTRKAGVYTK